MDPFDPGPYLGRDPLAPAGPEAQSAPIPSEAPPSEAPSSEAPSSEAPPSQQLPSAPLTALAALLGDARLVPSFHRTLLATDPAMRTVFPADPAPVLARFARALAHALEAVERAGGDEAEVERVLDFARHLGEDHRKLDLTPAHFEVFGTALARTLAHLAGAQWSDRLATTLETAYREFARAMLQGISRGAGPVRIGATVVDVQRPCRDVAVVRLLADEMVGYLPGQYVSVQTPYAPSAWRSLSPAFPTNPARQLEFHVRAVPGGATSGPLVRGAAPGDRWVLARPLGHLDVDRSGERPRDVLMIAGGTGIAPLRCLLVDMLRFPDNPRVHLFVGARYPGELYALSELVEIASTSPWLTVQPVAEEAEDPWWLRGQAVELPRTLHRIRRGRLVDVVTGFGAWADRQVLVAGSPAMVRATVSGLVAAGTPRRSILADPV